MKKKVHTRKNVLTRVGIFASMIVFIAGMMSVVFSQSTKERGATTRKSAPPTDRRIPDLQRLNRPPVDDGIVYVAERKITIDTQTGEHRKPTPEEIKQTIAYLKSVTNRSSEGLKAVVHPDGTRQVNLEGRFSNVVIARATPEGTMETRCVTAFDEALEFLGLRPETPSEAAARKAAKKSDQ